MGRKKLEIKARETMESKQVTFAKRRTGVEKKAQELATLCDIPLLLILFSPNKRLSWISGSRGTPEELLKSYAKIPFQERSRRKVEALEQLNRAFKKSGHEINIENFSQLNATTQSMKDLLTSLHDIRTNLSQKLGECETPTTIEQANQIEQILQTRLQQIEMHKELIEANQPTPSCKQILGEEKSCRFAKDFGVIGATSQEAWENKCMQPTDESATFLHEQKASSIGPCYLPSSCGASQYWVNPNTLNPCVHHSIQLDHFCCQIDDINKQTANFKRDAQYDNINFLTEDSDVLHSTSLWAKQDVYGKVIRRHHVPYDISNYQ